MSALWQDLRYAVRMLRKSPGFTAIALITLAIGIGANTIMFSLVNVLLLRPVQVSRIDDLAVCQAENADWHFPYSAYLELRENNAVFADVAGVGAMQPAVTWARDQGTGYARHACTNCVSSNYFSLLGAVPARGRWFLPEEERHGAEPVVVLSYPAWQRCGADPEMVGKQILLNGKSFEVVGVAPQGFTGTSLAGPELWVPLGCYGLFLPAWRTLSDDAMYYPRVIPVGRLKRGVPWEVAQARLQALVPELRSHYPTWWSQQSALKLSRPSRMSFFPAGVEEERLYFSLLSLCLMAVSAAVLLIACLNLAGMMMVQGTARQREIAIRAAVGGSRLRIVRQLLCECLLMSLAGGALGCLLALAGIRGVNAWIAVARLPVEIPASFSPTLDGRVLLGTVGFCVIATMLFGLRPALRLSRRNLLADLKGSSRDGLRSAPQGGWALRSWSVVGQTALSVVLVLAAALFTRSAVKVARAGADFDFDGKLLVEMDLSAGGYDPSEARRICDTLLDRLGALPGVASVALSCSCNFGGTASFSGSVYEYTPDAAQHVAGPKLVSNSVSCIVGPNYFQALGLPLQQGRCFDELDGVADAENIVVIDERLARKLRPDGNALGCLIQWGRPDEQAAPYRVVGIAPTLRTASEDMHQVQGQLYRPIRGRRLPAFIHVLASNRTRPGEDALIRSLSTEIHRLAPQLPVLSVDTLRELQQGEMLVWLTGLGARLALGFGAMALFLASLGLYAVKGYLVASRTAEIGIRKALGATPGNIMGMVLREGLTLTVVGLVAGLLLGLAVARLLGSLFYGVRPVDPVSIAVTVALLGVASLLAGYLPARRAAKVDPMVALRCE